MSCDRKPGHWESAKQKHTIESYEDYIAKNPEGEFAQEARERIQELFLTEDHLAWKHAIFQESRSSIKNYMLDFPEGEHLKEAKKKMSALLKKELLNDLKQDIINFLHGSKSSIRMLDRKKSLDEIPYTLSLVSGGFTIRNGKPVPDRGSVVIYKEKQGRFEIIGVVGSSSGKLAEITKMNFVPGVEIFYYYSRKLKRTEKGWELLGHQSEK